MSLLTLKLREWLVDYVYNLISLVRFCTSFIKKDFHLKGLEQLGAKISLESGYILAKAEYLKGNKISFDFPSVGATGNILMASVLARGETQIENAAKEPEIVQLCEMLNQLGANIIGIGTDKITVNGVDKLHPVDIDVIPDRIEAGT